MPVKDKGLYAIVIPHIEGERMGGIIQIITRKIESSNIEWIGWPKSGEPLMIVQFKGGGRYAYLGVTRQRAVAASWATSTGKYINERIKPHHKVVKLR